MTFQLGETLTLEKQPSEERVAGQTCSRKYSTGSRREWRLGVRGRPDLVLHDNRWDNGERDVVIARPEQVPPLPNPLSALLGKKRSQVDPHGHRLRVAVCLISPDANGWPTKSFPWLHEVQAACGPDLLQKLYDHGVTDIDTREAILGDDTRQRNRVCALLDPAKETAPIVLYTVTHVVPTLRHISWL
ncbi:hypothetical protein AB0G86_06215 [Streptomyces scabiei]|uniref:hypothetical protein n=1 Tax=Streptomyces scabiei TaxID=1930 RepID=UPI0033D5E803